MPFAAIWMNLEITKLSRVRKKKTSHMISLTGGAKYNKTNISKKQNKLQT